MTTHLTTSHGADFFGVDNHPLPLVRKLADYAYGQLPFEEGRKVRGLLEAPAERSVPADEAAQFAPLLLKLSAGRGIPKKLSALARLLGDAAARAAADAESWDWNLTAA
ncbi:hypothetical protein [Streptomyces sp. BH104]